MRPVGTGTSTASASPGRPPTVAITRPAGESAAFDSVLAAAGVEVLHRPTIRIIPAEGEALARAARAASEHDWVVFTSPNGVRAFAAGARAAGVEAAGALARPGVACVGPGTRTELLGLGRDAELVPGADFMAEGLIDAFRAAGLGRGQRVLLVQAERARPVLRTGLEALGAAVSTVVAYHTMPDAEGIAGLRADLAAGRIDVVAFTAGSTVEFFVNAGGRIPAAVRVAVIGPVTAEAARAAGVPVHIEARVHTLGGLAEAIVRALRPERG